MIRSGLAALLLAGGPAVRGRAGEPARPEPWSYGASLFAYFVPEDRDFLLPGVTADRGPWHLEARYNYEGLDAASAWAGVNLGTGQSVRLDLTAMVGGVFGNTSGVAPGCRFALGWKRLELYSEAEYVFNSDTWGDSFFYAWSELTLAFGNGARLGLVGQRTRAYESEREVQRGFLAGLSIKDVDLTAHLFNPDDPKPLWVLAASTEF